MSFGEMLELSGRNNYTFVPGRPSFRLCTMIIPFIQRGISGTEARSKVSSSPVLGDPIKRDNRAKRPATTYFLEFAWRGSRKKKTRFPESRYFLPIAFLILQVAAIRMTAAPQSTYFSSKLPLDMENRYNFPMYLPPPIFKT